MSVAYIPPTAGAVALGFAIPAATVVDVADQLLATGTARHAYIGIQPATLTQKLPGCWESTAPVVWSPCRSRRQVRQRRQASNRATS